MLLTPTNLSKRSAQRKTPLSATQLYSLLERDETPDTGAQPSIDQVLSTPDDPPQPSLQDRLAPASAITTPKTLPRPPQAEMHPEEAHRTTAQPSSSGGRLGFIDITTGSHPSIGSWQNSPLKNYPRQSLPRNMTSEFEFKFASESSLSTEAQKLMDNVRGEAARIKAKMIAEKEEQGCKDNGGEKLFHGFSSAGRKIAKPKGKAGRFSDIHMTQFKKMDSIANHASSFRTKPGFAQPTQQSLKRSGSKAGLDELERPQTAGKGTPGRPPPPFMRPTTAGGSSKPTLIGTQQERPYDPSPAKRLRRSEIGDVSKAKQVSSPAYEGNISSLSHQKSYLPGNPFSSTKASLARSQSTKIPALSPEKRSTLSRSGSVRSLKGAFQAIRAETSGNTEFENARTISQLPRSESTKSIQPLPPIPTKPKADDTLDTTIHPRSNSIKSFRPDVQKSGGLSSRLPALASLKSILRPSHKTPNLTDVAATAGSTPKRHNMGIPGSESAKKVDFTPSTKSRHAVKLAAAVSPNPAKSSCATSSSGPIIPYDPAAYIPNSLEAEDDDEWEDAESEVVYPNLPPSSSSPDNLDFGPVVNTFTARAKEYNRRESAEFKSIFMTLQHPSRSSEDITTLTGVNTRMNSTNPSTRTNIVTRSPRDRNTGNPSPSTIRTVRNSGVTNSIQPFEDLASQYHEPSIGRKATDMAPPIGLPHGLTGKKRRRPSLDSPETETRVDRAKERRERRQSIIPRVPGGWNDPTSYLPLNSADESKENVEGHEVHDEDEGSKRARKRARIEPANSLKEASVGKRQGIVGELKKNTTAREQAAKNAQKRKTGILSLSRLNMLARPKGRK